MDLLGLCPQDIGIARGTSVFKYAVFFCDKICPFFKFLAMHISNSHLLFLAILLTTPYLNHALVFPTSRPNTRLFERGDEPNLDPLIYKTPHCTTDIFWTTSLKRDVKLYVESCQHAVRDAVNDLVRNEDGLNSLDTEHEILDRTASSHTTKSKIFLPLRYTACAYIHASPSTTPLFSLIFSQSPNA